MSLKCIMGQNNFLLTSKTILVLVNNGTLIWSYASMHALHCPQGSFIFICSLINFTMFQIWLYYIRRKHVLLAVKNNLQMYTEFILIQFFLLKSNVLLGGQRKRELLLIWKRKLQFAVIDVVGGVIIVGIAKNLYDIKSYLIFL